MVFHSQVVVHSTLKQEPEPRKAPLNDNADAAYNNGAWSAFTSPNFTNGTQSLKVKS